MIPPPCAWFQTLARGFVRPATIDVGTPETTGWPPRSRPGGQRVLVALTEQVTNARIEGFNWIIQQAKRVGCGYRNQLSTTPHIAIARPRCAEQQHDRDHPAQIRRAVLLGPERHWRA